MIGVVSDHATFCKAIERLLRSKGRDEIVFVPPALEHIKNRLVPSALLILDAHLADASGIGKGGLTLIRRLRSEQAWRYVGFILVVAYEQAAGLGRWPDAEVSDTKGIAVLQMPFTVTQFQTILASTSLLSDAEWGEIHRRLGPGSVADRASKLGHDYENAFSQALSALREVEKLGAFPEPDVQRIRQEIHSICNRLTEERLSAFFTDLRALFTQTASLDLLDETCSLGRLNSRIANLEQFLPLVSLDRETGQLSEICQAAHEVRSIVRDLLTSLRAIKEKTTRESEGGN
jgi:CheY-like chemotaxis protein